MRTHVLLHSILMDKFFSVFGKIIIALIIIAVIGAGGYYFGNKMMKSSSSAPTTTPSVTEMMSPSPSQQIINTTPTIVQKDDTGRFAVTAGGIKPFSAYMLSGVAGWTKTEQKDANADTVTLSKGKYQLVIVQGAVGAPSCTFPGDQPQPMSIQLSSSSNIELLTGSPLRRGQVQSPSPDTADFAVCQKAQNGGYSTFTDFGIINYYTPTSPDSDMLAQMDAMTGSLQKQ